MSKTIEVAGAPAIAGLRFRTFAGESDYPEIVRVVVDSNQGDADYYNVDVARNNDAFLGFIDPQKDRIFVEVDGKMIGCGRVHVGRNISGERIYTPAFELLPEWRGKGIGTAVLRHFENRMREIAEGHPQDGPRYFQTWPMFESHADRHQLFRAHGYEPIRYSFDMVRPSMDDIPENPLPAGLEFRPVETSQLRTIWDANCEGFKDHWNHMPRPEGGFQAWCDSPTWIKELSAIAWDGDQCVGTVLGLASENEIAKLGRRRAWTESITVRRPWRRKGVARAMISHCLRLCRDAGYTEAALGVDAENLSGALHLYESMGYVVTKRATTFRKPMT